MREGLLFVHNTLARLNLANLDGAVLVDADLQEAKFWGSNLKNANLERAILRFTIFPDANLKGCKGCPTDW